MKNKKILIVGLGIGNMYKTVLLNSKFAQYEVYTLDIDIIKDPSYNSIEDIIKDKVTFDLSIICTPNFTHEEYVDKLIDISNVVLVEKPGLKDKQTWDKYFNRKKNIFMVKNNMFRYAEYNNITEFLNENTIGLVRILWLNKDRIPNPGSWFTNKALAYGGVSRDLIPHLLSIYYSIYSKLSNPESIFSTQFFDLDKIKNTDYGNVDPNGVYNVDDYCEIIFSKYIKLVASWKTPVLENNKIGVEIYHGDDNDQIRFIDFGLCPEKCYDMMIDFFLNLDSEDVKEQYRIDSWIHEILDTIK